MNTDGVFDYNPILFFSGIGLMVFSPVIFMFGICCCRGCSNCCSCSCCKCGTGLQSAGHPIGDNKRNRFHHHFSIDSETGDVRPGDNDTGKRECESSKRKKC